MRYNWDIKKIELQELRLEKNDISNYPSLKNFKLHWYYFIPILGNFWFNHNVKKGITFDMLSNSQMLRILFFTYVKGRVSRWTYKYGNLAVLILAIVATLLILFIGNWVLTNHWMDTGNTWDFFRSYALILIWTIYAVNPWFKMFRFKAKMVYLKKHSNKIPEEIIKR